MSIHPMTPADAAWFHMDGPANLAIVTGLLVTEKPLDFEKVREVVQMRLLSFERYSQRVVETGFPLATPHWEDMPHFDLDQHLHHIALPAPHDEEALRVLVSDIASIPLDHGQPLWQIYVVDDVQGGSAFIMRCHHCVADGTAMMTVSQKLFDPAPGATPPAQAAAATRERMKAPPLNMLDKAKMVIGGAGMLLGELLKTNDPQSPLKGEFALRKYVAWSKPVAIADIKAIGAKHGAKVNDVLVAGMTGALRTYLKGRGIDVNHTTVRAMVPVDLRPPERANELGNEFGLVILELAVSKARAEQRLALTKSRMDALKHSPEPMATRLLFDIFGRGPKALEDFANMLFGSKTSLVMTNVAGPREALYLAGVPIARMYGWAPHPGKELGMAISIMSYKGSAALTVIGDARLVPDPEVITEQFNREFEAMLRSMQAKPAALSAKRTKTPTPSSRQQKAALHLLQNR